MITNRKSCFVLFSDIFHHEIVFSKSVNLFIDKQIESKRKFDIRSEIMGSSNREEKDKEGNNRIDKAELSGYNCGY